jgi:hypothetical protein
MPGPGQQGGFVSQVPGGSTRAGPGITVTVNLMPTSA